MSLENIEPHREQSNLEAQFPDAGSFIPNNLYTIGVTRPGVIRNRDKRYERKTPLPPEFDPSWQEGAACGSSDVDFFATEKIEIRQAMAICRDECEIDRECLKFAIETNQEMGVWGGMDEDERRKFRRRIKDKERKDRNK